MQLVVKEKSSGKGVPSEAQAQGPKPIFILHGSQLVLKTTVVNKVSRKIRFRRVQWLT